MSQEFDQSRLFDPNRDPRWFQHGPLEIQFTPELKKHNGVIFHARSADQKHEADLTSGELAIILSLGFDRAKQLPEIIQDYNKWSVRINSDFDYVRIYRDLTRANLYFHIGRIEKKLGLGIFKKVGVCTWRLTSPDELFTR